MNDVKSISIKKYKKMKVNINKLDKSIKTVHIKCEKPVNGDHKYYKNKKNQSRTTKSSS